MKKFILLVAVRLNPSFTGTDFLRDSISVQQALLKGLNPSFTGTDFLSYISVSLEKNWSFRS
mgnify:CR=1 FL=1